MAQIENNSRRNTKIFTGHKNLRVDLTPMVDLGFLLISFFMISTILSQPNVANLVMPKDSVLKTPIHESAVLTLMPAANNKVDYFEGKDPEPSELNNSAKTKSSDAYLWQ
jgi:biopolymer transport protein ExbD